MMTLLTDNDRKWLLANGKLRRRIERATSAATLDFVPVVKLLTLAGSCTWLPTELDPDDTDRAFGLCDLGFGFPDLGWVSLAELAALEGPLGIGVERDRHFRAGQDAFRLRGRSPKKRRIRITA